MIGIQASLKLSSMSVNKCQIEAVSVPIFPLYPNEFRYREEIEIDGGLEVF